MTEGDGGLPDYEARCSPSFLSFTFRPPGHETRVTRDLDFRTMVANAPPELLIAWASFQTLCGIESVLKSIDGHLRSLDEMSLAARSTAAGAIPNVGEVLATLRKELGIELPRRPGSAPRT